jgi:hypothetical protein
MRRLRSGLSRLRAMLELSVIPTSRHSPRLVAVRGHSQARPWAVLAWSLRAKAGWLATQRPASGPGTPRLSSDKPRPSTRSPRPSATIELLGWLLCGDILRLGLGLFWLGLCARRLVGLLRPAHSVQPVDQVLRVCLPINPGHLHDLPVRAQPSSEPARP